MAETYEQSKDSEVKACGCGGAAGEHSCGCGGVVKEGPCGCKEKKASATGPCGNDHEGKDCGTKTASTEGCGGEPCMPAPTFSTFILSLASSAMVNLGEVPDPSTGKVESNLMLAKHTIDIISMLQEKIRDGLDEDERRLLEGVLYELRMKFVLKK